MGDDGRWPAGAVRTVQLHRLGPEERRGPRTHKAEGSCWPEKRVCNYCFVKYVSRAIAEVGRTRCVSVGRER